MAKRDKLESMMDASQDIIKELLRARIVELDTWIESIKTEMKANHQKMDASLGETKALLETMEACPVKMRACTEKREPAPKEMESMARSWGVPEGATHEETIRAAEDRAGEQRLAIRHHGQLKKWAQGKDGPRQKFAAACGWFTRHAIPALHKGHVRKRPGKTLGSRIENRGLKQRRTKDNAVRGTPEGRTCEKRRWTQPRCDSGMKGRGTKQRPHL
jgi:hypothetical protein